jgi:hypothetical protein
VGLDPEKHRSILRRKELDSMAYGHSLSSMIMELHARRRENKKKKRLWEAGEGKNVRE